MDGKPLIIEGSHIEPSFYVKTIKDEDGKDKLMIETPDAADEAEEKSDNQSIKKMRKAMQAIN